MVSWKLIHTTWSRPSMLTSKQVAGRIQNPA